MNCLLLQAHYVYTKSQLKIECQQKLSPDLMNNPVFFEDDLFLFVAGNEELLTEQGAASGGE